MKPEILYAWVGEDEFGSGEHGLKQGVCPAGTIPLVAIHQSKMNSVSFLEQLQKQADVFGKPIRLCAYKFDREIVTLTPRDAQVISSGNAAQRSP